MEQPIPLSEVTATHVSTRDAAYYLNRSQSTMMRWQRQKISEVSSLKMQGRLSWSVADIKKVLGF